MVSVMNEQSNNISSWMKSSCFLNQKIKKRVYMNSSILYDSVPLNQATEVKCLGVHVDEAVTWKSHANENFNLNNSVGIIRRYRAQ